MKGTTKQMVVILLAGAMAAVVANSVHPGKIAWVQDWSGQVEASAVKQEIKVILLAVALEKSRSGDAVFIDARSTDHFAKGHIPGAISVPFEQFDEFFPVLVDLIDSGRELVVYCSNRECDDALLLAIELQTMGCSNLLLYVDGFEFWQKQGGLIKKEGGATSSSPVDSEDAFHPAEDGP